MTAVQEQVLKELPLKSDMLVRAKTGTGKSLAFLISALETCIQNKKFGKSRVPILIVSPTRELAIQIGNEAKKLVGRHRMKVKLAVGGTSRGKLLDDLKYQTDILVGTPGRLADILDEVHVATKLSECEVLVLDEADQLLEFGFKSELERIVEKLNRSRKTLMFSATLSPAIKLVAMETLKQGYLDIDTVPENETDTHLLIRQSFSVVPLKEQFAYLFKTVEQHKQENPASKIIVFFQTTKMVQMACTLFTSMGLDSMQLHSQLSQPVRTKISDRFRKARSAILLTSDVSARGVDYPNVSLVVSFGMPQSRDQYIHRIGRTGRAGNEGEALLILSPFEKRFLEQLKTLPVREEMRLTPHISSKYPEYAERVASVVKTMQEEEREEVLYSTAGYCNPSHVSAIQDGSLWNES
ncbi:P-loop containing nucleoside triphosphate hydrolase protein [Gorgonomyces haynaldii]|nr:P-loop containing nucleoside triphosphate hydrolase protein [Gorgonomyces haynaldii]